MTVTAIAPLEMALDLNMLRDGHVTTDPSAFLAAVRPELQPGLTVVAIDEDGVRYLAVIETVHADGFVDVAVKLDSGRRYGISGISAKTAVPTDSVAQCAR